jgi:hypothetical protein
MKNRFLLFACLMFILMTVFVQVSQAQTWDKRTRITVDKPWTLPGNTCLQPGTYVMRLYDSPSNRQIVEVWNADETKLEARVIGLPAYRLAPSNETVLNFYEHRTDEPAPAQQWFHPGDLSGVEFPGKNSAPGKLAYVTVPEPAPQPPAVAEEQPPAPPAPPEPAPEVQPQPEPPQIVENVPPPQPELPRTAGDAPIVGLIGLLTLGGAALLRSFVKS